MGDDQERRERAEEERRKAQAEAEAAQRAREREFREAQKGMHGGDDRRKTGDEDNE